MITNRFLILATLFAVLASITLDGDCTPSGKSYVLMGLVAMAVVFGIIEFKNKK